MINNKNRKDNNERGEITTNSMDTPRIIWEYYEQLYANNSTT